MPRNSVKRLFIHISDDYNPKIIISDLMVVLSSTRSLQN